MSAIASFFRRSGRAASALALLGGAASAQEPALASRPSEPRFAAAVRVFAGESELGAKRLYPSPALHDMNADGRADLVSGDLRGRITVALREAGPGAPRFAAEKPLRGRDGKDLDFANW
jgi:hypothetical protein